MRNSNWQNGIYSPSSLAEYLHCPRKGYLSYVLHLRALSADLHKHFGSSFHAGVAAFRKQHDKALACQAFKDFYETQKVEESEKKNLVTGLSALSQYCDKYKDEALFAAEYVEVAFSLSITDEITLIGIIDAILKEGSTNTVIDSKTSSWALTDFVAKQYENDIQQSCYWMAVQEILGQIDMSMIDHIKIPAKKEEDLARRIFMRTELQIVEARNTIMSVHSLIKARLSLPKEDQPAAFHQNPTSCDRYGGCPYLKLCMYGLDHPSFQTDFVVKPETEERE